MRRRPGPREKLQRGAVSAGPMYPTVANVSEARKALWDKTSGLQVQLGIALRLL